MKIEIGQIKVVDKGSLKAFFSLLIHPQGQKILDCKYFVKGDQCWWAMPTKEIKKDGLKSDYIPIVSYFNKQYESELKTAVLEELKKQVNDGQGQEAPKQKSMVQSNASDIWF